MRKIPYGTASDRQRTVANSFLPFAATLVHSDGIRHITAAAFEYQHLPPQSPLTYVVSMHMHVCINADARLYQCRRTCTSRQNGAGTGSGS